METLLSLIRPLIPRVVFNATQPIYHWLLAWAGALVYGFPSRKLHVVGITGTKGKSSTTELLGAIFAEAGYKTAVASTIRFTINGHVEPNMFKMTMPGRFFMQRFLRKAVTAGATHAVIEMSSEGAKLFRHVAISMNGLVFLNLAPEHIESHGSFEKYRDAKVSLARKLANSHKPDRMLVVNGLDVASPFFVEAVHGKIPRVTTFTLHDAEPFTLSDKGLSMTFKGERIESPLRGTFSIENMLAAATYAAAQGVSPQTIARALSRTTEIPGRVQFIRAANTNVKAHAPLRAQEFDVIVDYAHTPDSLTKLYEAFPNRHKVAVLGNTGGGRDTWKRPEMARIADELCDQIILTNEDPYDEDPREIVDEMAKAITRKPLEICMDRRQAIRKAIELARPGGVVLITGKGTDPYIMGKNGTKTPWSDARVAEEELIAFLSKKA
jgi:UDP-N-acetylmuramoyl-L-alanyl-D-glutamate--2,6-diaminopimelate ligase